MTPSGASGTGRSSAAKLLAALAVLALVVAILTPEPAGDSSRGPTSYSTAPTGVRMAYELAQRLGWHVERRLAPLDTVPPRPSVQVVLAPVGGVVGHEVHSLLDNVRRGGGLVFSLDGNDELADSLGLDAGKGVALLSGTHDPQCPSPQSITGRALLVLPTEVSDVVFDKRPPAGETTLVAVRGGRGASVPVAIGFPFGRGKIAVTSNSAVFSNEAVRNCPWKADLAVVSMLEYTRTAGATPGTLAFDEYHHGFGVHGGTLSAAATYLAHTPSGHFMIQALIAGLVLLMAKAPRPVPPRDTTMITRRSPLEHADALGRAYADVGATRTAASRLVSGLRRRLARWVPVGPGATDDAFLDAVGRRVPQRAADVATLRRALEQSGPARDLEPVGDALNRVEHAVLSSSPSIS